MLPRDAHGKKKKKMMKMMSFQKVSKVGSPNLPSILMDWTNTFTLETYFHICFTFGLVKEKEFNEKRKKHYNEYSKVKLARKLIEQELKDIEDDGDATDSKADDTALSEVPVAAAVDTEVMRYMQI